MRRLGFVLMALAAVVLSACSATTPATSTSLSPAGTPSETAAVAKTDRGELVGLWRVTAPDAGENTWLYLGADEARVWSECGFQMGGWSAADGVLLVDIYAWHMGCRNGDDKPVIGWLDETVAYERAADGWALLSASGAVTARLRIDGLPPRHPDASDEARLPPVIDDEAEALLASVAVPDGIRPATAEELVGRWFPREPAPNDPHLVVDAQQRWTSSDGCNGNEGEWAVSSRGTLLTTTGFSTLVGCEGSHEPGEFGRARAAGFDGDVLILYGPGGEELAELIRG